MKAYLYDKMKSKIATIIRKEIEIEYTGCHEIEQYGLAEDIYVAHPSRAQAMSAAEKILDKIGITRDETQNK